MYLVYIKDTANNLVYDVPYTSFDFTEELNNDRDARFTIDFLAMKDIALAYNTTVSTIMAGGIREIWIEKNGTKVYYGVISDYRVTKSDQGQVVIQLASFGFLSLFSKRRTSNSRIFSGTDAASIAWTLINESQTADPPYSDFGIVQGAAPTTINRSETYQFANIKDEIVNLSNLKVANGFDMEIDNLKNFNVYFPFKGSQRSEIVFDSGNLNSWDIDTPLLSGMANKIYVSGSGVNADVNYVYLSSSSDYKSAFKVLEEYISEPNIQQTADLTDAGNKYLTLNQAPIPIYTLYHLDDDPDILNLSLGDSPLVTITELDLTRVFLRLKKRNVKVEQNGLAIVTLTLQVI